MEVLDGSLHLGATDLDVSISVVVEAEGLLPPCVVSCPELIRRIKASNGETCSLRLEAAKGKLVVNGGRVDHTLQTMDLGDFPAAPTTSEGEVITIDGLKFKDALATALVGAAAEPTRYAINGVLLESDDDGLRLVATDGRRLVTVELEPADREFRGQVLLSARQAALVSRFVDRKCQDSVRVFVNERPDKDGEHQPSEICIVGRDWLLKASEQEGHFPVYRDVVPESQSKFVVDREAFIEALAEVSLATTVDSKAVGLDLTSESVTLSAESPGLGESSGSVAATFAGGGDGHVVSGFNPGFLLDAFKTLPGERVVIDVGQNLLDRVSNAVRGRPALMYSLEDPHVRWLIMPVNIGQKPSRATLGSNYPGGGQGESPPPEKGSESTTNVDASASTAPPRRRRRVEHVWPEIGTRLDGQYEGETYAALVVAAPRLKSGRALQIINGPALGRVFNSMTAAMVAATARQRQHLGTGSGRTGLPASGWEFWGEAQLQQKLSA